MDDGTIGRIVWDNGCAIHYGCHKATLLLAHRPASSCAGTAQPGQAHTGSHCTLCCQGRRDTTTTVAAELQHDRCTSRRSAYRLIASPAHPPLSFPHAPPICTIDGDWQTQVLPGAPGTARQGPTRTIMLVNSGGNATQPRAPGHDRPRAASRAARHGRLSAATRAPGADVPLATTAGAPGQYCLSAALRAPGHGRPLAAPARGGA